MRPRVLFQHDVVVPDRHRLFLRRQRRFLNLRRRRGLPRLLSRHRSLSSPPLAGGLLPPIHLRRRRGSRRPTRLLISLQRSPHHTSNVLYGDRPARRRPNRRTANRSTPSDPRPANRTITPASPAATARGTALPSRPGIPYRTRRSTARVPRTASTVRTSTGAPCTTGPCVRPRSRARLRTTTATYPTTFGPTRSTAGYRVPTVSNPTRRRTSNFTGINTASPGSTRPVVLRPTTAPRATSRRLVSSRTTHPRANSTGTRPSGTQPIRPHTCHIRARARRTIGPAGRAPRTIDPAACAL